MPIIDVLLQIIIRFGQILGAPIKQPDMLWILIPIYLNWVFIDYFLERKGTGFGHAMTNGIVTLWAGTDWMRQTIKGSEFGAGTITKIGISISFIIYGLVIMVESAKAKPIAKYIGRVREVSYFAIVATPIFYGVISVDLTTIAAILLFFPIVYGLMEVIDRLLPAPPGEIADGMPGMSMPELEPGPSAEMQMPPMGKMPKF
jgi:Na+/H+ antiporter NhaD/arsenite permease-like protein